MWLIWSLLLAFLTIGCHGQGGTGLNLPPFTPPDLSDLDLKFPVSIDVGNNCSAELNVDWCSLDLAPNPENCLTFGGLLTALTPGLGVGDLLNSDSEYNPASWQIDTAYLDRCGESVHLATSVPHDFKIIPGFLNLNRPNISFLYEFGTEEYEVKFASLLVLGRKRFRVVVTKSNDVLDIYGKAIGTEIRIGQFLSDITSSLVPGEALASVIEQAKIGDLVLSDLELNVRYSDAGLGLKFTFNAGIGSKKSKYQIIVNRGSWGGDTGIGVILTGKFHNLHPVDQIRKLTGVDLSFLPVIGDLKVQRLVMMAATKSVNHPVVELGVDEVTGVQSGLTLLLSTASADTNHTKTYVVSISPRSVSFHLPPSTQIRINDLLSGVLDSLSINLPSWFSLDSFLSQSIDQFTYDVDTKILMVMVTLTDPIYLLDEGIVLTDSTLSIDVSFSGDPGSKFGVLLESTWEIRDVTVGLKVSKPLGSKVWMAVGRPDVDIPIGALLQKFAVSIIPAGPIRNGLKKIGFDAFHIVDPLVAIYLGDVVAAKVSGTAEIGNWKASTVETFVGKIQGATVMAMGLVLERVPVTTVIKKITDGAINLRRLPGASILDHTTVALVTASEVIPRGTQYISFESPLLSEMDILDGMGVAASMNIPEDCGGDGFCRVLQRVLGTGTALVIKGTVNIPNIRLEAVVPANISLISGAYITDVGFEVELGIRTALGVTGKLILSKPTSVFPAPITLSGSLGMSTSGAYLQMSMKGLWYDAFTLKFLAIGNLHFRVAISPDPILISVLELGGEAIIGYRDTPGVVPIHGSLYIGIDRIIPTQSYFSGRINKLTIPAIINAFKPSVTLPSVLNKVGFPDGFNCSFALESRILPNGVVIPRGFYFTGMLSIFDFKVWADAKVSLEGVYFNMTARPFSLANGLISLEGLTEGAGPNIFIDIGWNPPSAKVQIRAKTTLLLFTATVNVSIDHQGMYFEVTGKLLNLFEARLKLQAVYSSLKALDFMVEGSFQQRFMQSVEDDIIQALNTYRRNADKAIGGAQHGVDGAKRKFDDAARAVGQQQAKVDSANRHFDNAVAAFNGAKRAVDSKKANFDRATASVARARSAVNSKNADLDRAVGSLRNAERSVQSKQRAFDQAVGTLNSKKRGLSNAQGALNRERDKFRRKERSCPRSCRKRRDVTDVFMTDRLAKSVLDTSRGLPRKQRGWGGIGNFFEERKEEVAEKGKEVARATRCAALATARQTCLAGLRVIQGAISAASGTLEAAKLAVSAAARVVDASRVSLEVAKGVLRAAQGPIYVARAGLTAAQGVLRAAEETTKGSKVLLDAANGILSAAQFTVDKSRISLDAAKAVLKGAAIVVGASKVTLDGAVGVLEGVKYANRFGVFIAEQATRGIGLVDIRELSFHVRLAAVETGSFGVKIRASFFGSGEKTYSFHINLRSFDDMIDFLVDEAKDALGL